jgi:hypothetical protein
LQSGRRGGVADVETEETRAKKTWGGHVLALSRNLFSKPSDMEKREYEEEKSVLVWKIKSSK